MARAPTGQTSTQMVHSWPFVRMQIDSCQTATPMSTKSTMVDCSAPLGQLFMQASVVQRTQGISSASMYGAPSPLSPVKSILMQWEGQTRTHSLQRLH